MLKYFFHTFGSGTVLEPQTLSYVFTARIFFFKSYYGVNIEHHVLDLVTSLCKNSIFDSFKLSHQKYEFCYQLAQMSYPEFLLYLKGSTNSSLTSEKKALTQKQEYIYAGM